MNNSILPSAGSQPEHVRIPQEQSSKYQLESSDSENISKIAEAILKSPLPKQEKIEKGPIQANPILIDRELSSESIDSGKILQSAVLFAKLPYHQKQEIFKAKFDPIMALWKQSRQIPNDLYIKVENKFVACEKFKEIDPKKIDPAEKQLIKKAIHEKAAYLVVEHEGMKFFAGKKEALKEIAEDPEHRQQLDKGEIHTYVLPDEQQDDFNEMFKAFVDQYAAFIFVDTATTEKAKEKETQPFHFTQQQTQRETSKETIFTSTIHFDTVKRFVIGKVANTVDRFIMLILEDVRREKHEAEQREKAYRIVQEDIQKTELKKQIVKKETKESSIKKSQT